MWRGESRVLGARSSAGHGMMKADGYWRLAGLLWYCQCRLISASSVAEWGQSLETTPSPTVAPLLRESGPAEAPTSNNVTADDIPGAIPPHKDANPPKATVAPKGMHHFQ